MTDFATLFGRLPEIVASAPGRVNLIGEHTDYNGGFVLPIAINRETRIEIAPRTDDLVTAWSAEFPDTDPATYRLGEERREGDWLDYVKGVTYVLRQAGIVFGGFCARIESDVPPGSGLSSSAALQIALLRALSAMASLPADPIRLARLGQQAETDFVGAPVGIMDQLAVLLGKRDAALFLDTRSLEWRFVALPSSAALLIFDSGIRHQLASGEYGKRREECSRAAAALGVGQLRDLDAADLPAIDALPDPLNRRARHVVTENERVLRMVAALEAGNLPECGRLLQASHDSLWHDYDVSLPQINQLVGFAVSQPGVFGARLTGAGFGGAVLGLVTESQRDAAARNTALLYQRATGRALTIVD